MVVLVNERQVYVRDLSDRKREAAIKKALRRR